MLGHIFPVYLKFRGGRGGDDRRCGPGIYPYYTIAMLVALGCYALIRWTTGWVSLGSAGNRGCFSRISVCLFALFRQTAVGFLAALGGRRASAAHYRSAPDEHRSPRRTGGAYERCGTPPAVSRANACTKPSAGGGEPFGTTLAFVVRGNRTCAAQPNGFRNWMTKSRHFRFPGPRRTVFNTDGGPDVSIDMGILSN